MKLGFRLVFGAMVVATGANALVIEQAFEKLLATVVGATTTAGALVLATYFVGMALGALTYRAVAARLHVPLLVYVAAEALVGLYALALGLLFTPLQEASMRVVQSAGLEPLPTMLVRVVVACLWVFPPTLCMGVSFPAIVGTLRANGIASEGQLSRFYALNLLGAWLAATFAPYVLFSMVGVRGALFCSAALQTVVVLTALLVAKRKNIVVPKSSAEASPRAGSALATPAGRRIAVLAFLSGAVVFGCEVLWLHLMGVTLGMSVFTFAAMLSVVLASLALGGAVVSSRFCQKLKAEHAPALLAVGGMVFALSSRSFDDVPIWLLKLAPHVDGFYAAEFCRWLLAAVVVLPSCALLGSVYPLLLRSPIFDDAPEQTAGLMSALNAIGCMVGALLVSQLLLDVIGSEGSIYAIAVVAALSALVLTLWQGSRALAFAAPGLALVVAAVLPQLPGFDPVRLTAGTNVYFRPAFVRPNTQLVFWHEDGQGGITTVAQSEDGSLTLLTNGKFQGNNSGEVGAQSAFSLLPLALTPGRDAALVIGLGTGHSARVLHDAGMRQLDVAEIASGIVAAARGPFSALNHAVLDDPQVTTWLEDGRNHLLRTSQKYDIISMELTSVWFAGIGSLYSEEFYAIAKQKLAPNGILQQWLQFHHIGVDEAASAIAALRANFAHVAVWFIGGQGILIASDAPIAVRSDVVSQLRAEPRLVDVVAMFEAATHLRLEDLPQAQVLDEGAVDRFIAPVLAGEIPRHNDGTGYLEYWTPRHNLERINHVEVLLQAFAQARAP